MIITLICIGIYIAMVIISFIGPYIEFRVKHCKKGNHYTLNDLANYLGDDFIPYYITALIPVLNLATAVVSLTYLIAYPIWNRIKNIRIV